MQNTHSRSPGMRALWLLAPGQVISWGTLYYGITFLAQPIQTSTGWSLPGIFGAYSAGLLLAALCAPLAGQLLARHGGRWGLSLGSVLASLSLAGLAAASGPYTFLLAWLLAGVAMALTLYEAAFTALHEFAHTEFRRAMTLLTLVGGFASTVFWPLSYWLEGLWGWRLTLLGYAALHVLVCLPLHRALPRVVPAVAATEVSPADMPWMQMLRSPAYWGLAVAIGMTALLGGTLSAHAGLLLADRAVSPTLIMLSVTLFGPMQVAGRLLDMLLAQRLSVRWSGYVAHLMLPTAMVLLLLAKQAPWLAVLFACLYGASNGVLTIVRGMAPAELLGSANYGVALGWVSAPGLFARALAPAMAAYGLAQWGGSATLLGLTCLGVLGWAAFVFAYRARPATAPLHRVQAKQT
ncbi:MFS transporter [Chitinimonas prasina]|uniref:MFS transporter n=1 Tax=Chitinimonas prasina TaxID=1434937 RepID=UPI0024E0CB2E|nr:MFS transporter [Chitinimonas prasina]